MKGRAKGIVKGTLFSAFLTVLLAVVLATAMYFCSLPQMLVEVLVCVIAVLSCAVGAFAVAKASGTKGLLTGGSVGLLYFVLLIAISAVITKQLSLETHNVIMLAMTVFSGMLGGVLAMR